MTAVEPWELTAREEIRELVARYAHHADGGRFDELVALFAEDGVLPIDDREPLARPRRDPRVPRRDARSSSPVPRAAATSATT